MTILVLLPGMDGTGSLFEFLLPHLPSSIKAQVISYPSNERLGYQELSQLVLAQLPRHEPFAILGESFSGPVAAAVAAQSSPVALILACSFVGPPRPMLSILSPLVSLLPSPSLLLSPLSSALLGKYKTPSLRVALGRALGAVDATVLKYRGAAALEANAQRHLAAVLCPVLYLQATEDRVIPPACAAEVVRVKPQATITRIKAPHFLLQTQPAAAARCIEEFIRKAENAA